VHCVPLFFCHKPVPLVDLGHKLHGCLDALGLEPWGIRIEVILLTQHGSNGGGSTNSSSGHHDKQAKVTEVMFGNLLAGWIINCLPSRLKPMDHTLMNL
jgi:hypothetical protein